MLKMSPFNGVLRFKQWVKLSPRYAFKILKKIGKQAFKLELPPKLQGIHNTFYVYHLEKYHGNEDNVILI